MIYGNPLQLFILLTSDINPMNTQEQTLNEKLARLRATYKKLSQGDVRNIHLMLGTHLLVAICDDLYPIAEIKKEYLRRLKYRILELKLELMELRTKPSMPKKIMKPKGLRGPARRIRTQASPTLFHEEVTL